MIISCKQGWARQAAGQSKAMRQLQTQALESHCLGQNPDSGTECLSLWQITNLSMSQFPHMQIGLPKVFMRIK